MSCHQHFDDVHAHALELMFQVIWGPGTCTDDGILWSNKLKQNSDSEAALRW